MLELVFQILYAKEEHELETAIVELQSLPHMPYVQRVNTFLLRQCEWVLLYRTGVLTRGQNTTIRRLLSVF